MSTWNGCGTVYYGWTDEDHKSRTATQWVVAFLFPIFPLARFRLVRRGPETEGFLHQFNPLTDLMVPSFSDEFIVYERLPLNTWSVLRTYLSAYMLLPIVLLLPIFGIALAFWLFEDQLRSLPEKYRAVPAILGAIWWILVGIYVVRQTRGKSGL